MNERDPLIVGGTVRTGIDYGFDPPRTVVVVLRVGGSSALQQVLSCHDLDAAELRRLADAPDPRLEELRDVEKFDAVERAERDRRRREERRANRQLQAQHARRGRGR